MNRTFALPLSAAVVGILLAVGVSAAKRSATSHWQDHDFVTVDVRHRAELADAEVVLGELERTLEGLEVTLEQKGLVAEVLAEVEAELRAVLETESELTEVERREIQKALDDLKAPPPTGSVEEPGSGGR